MQKIIISLLSILLLRGSGSGQSYTIEAQNLSAKSFDNVHVFIDTSLGEEPATKFGKVLPGETLPTLTVGELFGSGHQKMTGTAVFYSADTILHRAGLYTGGMVVYR